MGFYQESPNTSKKKKKKKKKVELPLVCFLENSPSFKKYSLSVQTVRGEKHPAVGGSRNRN
jgi:hypothetical protein